jgi:hypothetical protein
MPSRKKKPTIPFKPSDIDLSTIRANPYIQRLIEDAKLRENIQQAIDASKKAYTRLSNGKAPHKALVEDKKLQNDLRHAFEAAREASMALTEAPKKQVKKSRRFGRKVMVVVIGGGVALIASEKLRSKVLDTLFGAEEEFEYTPPASPPPAQPATPVSSA